MGDSVAVAARSDLVGVALAAGAGRRLWPLTLERPKVLCPVGGRPLLGWALDSLVGVVDEVVVNVHHHSAVMLAWLEWACGGRAGGGGPPADFWRSFASRPPELPTGPEVTRIGTLPVRGPAAPGPEADLWASIEGPEALGTAGALGSLAGFLDGRGVLAVNADTLTDANLAQVVAAWDGERPLVAYGGPGAFRPGVDVVASITPWESIVGLPATPSGLFGHLWRHAETSGALHSLSVDTRVFDCGTPQRYLAANLAVAGGLTSMEGQPIATPSPVGLTRSVLWSGAEVIEGEVLDGAIRTTAGRTVLARPVPTVAGHAE